MGFFDGGGKAVKFEQINQGASGYIVGQYDAKSGREVPYLESQQTDYTTKEPKVYKDGNPVMQATILLQTDERVDEDDDGQRTVYVNKTRMKRAIQKALREAGAGDLEIGGILTIWMTGYEASTGGGSPAKKFDASYVKAVGGLAPEPASAPAVSAPPAAPVAAPPAPPVAAAAPPAPPAPVAAAPVAPPAAPVAAPPAPPVAAPPAAPAAAAAPPAPPSAPYTPPAAPAAPPAAPVAAAPAAAPAASGSNLPF